MNLTKEDIVAFCDRHPDIARTPENFMIAYEWVAGRGLEVTAANLDLAHEVCQGLFEPAPPSEEEQSRMRADEFLKAVVLPEFKKMQRAPNHDKNPLVRGRRGTPDGRVYAAEEEELMSAKEYREKILGIRRGNGL
jgi:hypothetical protein